MTKHNSCFGCAQGGPDQRDSSKSVCYESGEAETVGGYLESINMAAACTAFAEPEPTPMPTPFGHDRKKKSLPGEEEQISPISPAEMIVKIDAKLSEPGLSETEKMHLTAHKAQLTQNEETA